MVALLVEGVPAECMAGTFNSHGWIALAVTVAGLAGAVYSLAKAFEWLCEEIDCRRHKKEPPDRLRAKAGFLAFGFSSRPHGSLSNTSSSTGILAGPHVSNLSNMPRRSLPKDGSGWSW